MDIKSPYYEDFELWCRECVRITDKLTGLPVPFNLNAPQRRVLAIMEEQRKAGRPVRLIMLKARQWGGSTLVQIYMAWMQIVRHRGWNSIICGHVKDAAANIKGMYSRLLAQYPAHLKEPSEAQFRFLPYESSRNVCHIPAAECTVTISSAQAPDSIRGVNAMMAHLSEVAFWGDGRPEAASRMVRAVAGTVPRMPDSVVVMESTADGQGGYFHQEWLRAVEGKSDKTPVFVPWHEIEIYSLHLTEDERRSYLQIFTPYEHGLLKSGIDIDKVAWYHDKLSEYESHTDMMAEYPTTPEEAFVATSSRYFPSSLIENISLLKQGTEISADGIRVMAAVVRPHKRLYTMERTTATRLSSRKDADLIFESHKVAHGSLRTLLSRLCEDAAQARAQLLVAVADSASLPLAELYLERGAACSLILTDDELPVHQLTPEMVSRAAEAYRQLLSDGKIADTDTAIPPLLTPLLSPADAPDAVIARFMAASAFTFGLVASPFSPADFY